MFEGIIDQLRPVAHHCSVQFDRLMWQLETIEGAIRDGAAETEFGDRILRVSTSLAAASPPQSLGAVPLDQMWVLDYVWADTAGWTLASPIGVNRFGPTNVSFVQRVVMMPGEEWYFVPPAGAINFAVQMTRQYLAERPRRAASGSGAPEGRTLTGTPMHELARDMIPIR